MSGIFFLIGIVLAVNGNYGAAVIMLGIAWLLA